jgi:uncharacterized protein (TIGR03382 family)
MRRIPWIGMIVAAWFLGGSAPPAEGKGAVKVTFTTTPVPAPNNTYTPNNAVAVWTANGGGTFMRTIGQWVQIRQQYLVAWQAAAGTNDTDAVSGASRLSHTAPLTTLWNLRDRAGTVVPDGTYTIRMELAESNATTANQNNQGTFTFVKGAAPQTQTALTSGGFTNVTIEFDPNAINCADGVVDAPEKCERSIAAGMPGACPTACAVAADACMPNKLVGDAMLCSAECVVQPITACANGDGCCAAGCTDADDDDCGPGGGGGGGSPEVSGGCATGGGGSLAGLGVLGVLALLARRRRG